MKDTIRLILILTFSLLILSPVYASANMGVPFSVEPILPDNQASGVSYFDLRMEPGQEQDLEVLVSNTSDQTLEVLINAHSGVTNTNGVIVYDGSLPVVKANTTPIFDELIEVKEERLTVPANSEITAVVHIKSPKESFDGLILGGLHFLLEASDSPANSGVSIQHQYAYVIGVNLREEANTQEIEAQVAIESIEQTEVYGQPGLKVSVNNSMPTIISNADVSVHLYAANDLEKPIIEQTHSMFSIAPSLSFDYLLQLEDKELKQGDYLFKLTIQNETYDLILEETFSIP